MTNAKVSLVFWDDMNQKIGKKLICDAHSCQEYFSFTINFYHGRFSANTFWYKNDECIPLSVMTSVRSKIFYEFVSAHYTQHQSSVAARTASFYYGS